MEDLGFGAELLNQYEQKTVMESGDDTPRNGLSGAVESVKQSQVKTSVFVITGMTCAACSGAIEKHLGSVEGVSSISVSLLLHKANVTYDLATIRPRKIIEEIEDIGFDAELQADESKSDIRDIVKQEMIKKRNSVLLATLMYLPIGIMIWIIPITSAKSIMTQPVVWNGNSVYVLVLLVISTIFQFVIGKAFYLSAYRSLKHKTANMDVLVVISTTTAWLYGFALCVSGYEHEDPNHSQTRMNVMDHVHHWETSSVLIYIIIIGKYIEAYSKSKTLDKLQELASLKVTKANLIKQKSLSKV